MKNLHQVLKVLLLITIYCIGISSSAKSLSDANAQTIEQNNEQKKYFSSAYKILQPHAQESQICSVNLAEFVAPNYESHSKGFWVVLKSSELLFNARFKQYIIYSKTLLIRHRKSDLIFPFHNFW
ncbi:hypothetical protein [Maribacter sp. ACAM166]|uniref:hypothetical protein n=1 Tax=Maribacter sp. ACAM166 TaxID=2508996 RepID=UPI0010FED1DE|nr:hypothetical protein [Maribacter sp. ACAM166]TLP80235.1 hypothetical protein ES765_08565 [Maribacter sp. ACAM166]